MLFNSWQFLIFFPSVVALHFLLPHRWRWALLLAASCVFYMAFVPVYILILLGALAADYYIALRMERVAGRSRALWLTAAVLANFGVLFVFKYFNFFNENLAAAAGFLGGEYSAFALEVVLPIGLSFHTFQSVSYLIEVYRGEQPAERHAGYLALYVMFFPQLVAGPIERPGNLLPQLQAPRALEADRVLSGLALMLWGFFKKLVVADRLAMYVDVVYGSPEDFHGGPLLVATYFFAFQIYCDFSGYSDIAIGASRVLGVNLMQNFRTPYFSAGFGEFWRRWHISLSTWFRDYLYIPLGGSRASTGRVYWNLLVVFVVSGLWHGASWNFVIWGALHGLFVVGERAVAAVWPFGRVFREGSFAAGAVHALRVVLVFHAAVFCWIFFRAETFGEAMHVITHMFSPTAFHLHSFYHESFFRKAGVLVIVLLVGLEAIRNSGWFERLRPRAERYALDYVFYAFLCVVILATGVLSGDSFIYFQF